MAAEELQEEFPEAKVITVDTLCASMGQGLLVDLAVQEKRKGKDIEAVRDFVRGDDSPSVPLVHSGRFEPTPPGAGAFPPARRLWGTCSISNQCSTWMTRGIWCPWSRPRDGKKSIEALLKHMEESAIDPQNQRIYISHGDCLDEARALAAMIQERLHVVSVTIGDVGPVIGAHSGLGTLALFFPGHPTITTIKWKRFLWMLTHPGESFRC